MKVYIIIKESGAWSDYYSQNYAVYSSLEAAEKGKKQLKDKIQKLKEELKTVKNKAEFIYQNPDIEYHTFLIEEHNIIE